MAVPRYNGRFGPIQAERLLWRAGFGPRRGEARALAKLGLDGAVQSLTRVTGAARMIGPEPHDDDGLPLAPTDAYGHDVLFALDRMVRSDQPARERLALSWHDWFATGDIGQVALNLGQFETFRRLGFGSFKDLFLAVTVDPAMLIWLSGIDNTKDAPNENYGREMMELFALGVDAGYSEDDVREQARSLTGWRTEWQDGVGYTNFHYDPDYYDTGSKTIFGTTGNYDWRDSCRLCLEHPAHPGYLVDRLWSYFFPIAPPRRTRSALIDRYNKSGRSIRPLIEAMLTHPLFYDGPRMVKPPLVQIAGMLRARGGGVQESSWVWVADDAGQRPFSPPNVAGWDEARWLDTARFSGRWSAGGVPVNASRAPDDGSYPADETAAEAVVKALAFWGKPTVSAPTRAQLINFANRVETIATADWQQSTYRGLRQNALRVLIASSPEYQTC